VSRERAVHCLECPACHTPGSLRVIDTRAIKVGVRRRRQCDTCGVRLTTYEVIEPPLGLGVLTRERTATV
jgi:transcriptional regulator NrdR family protein